MDKITKYTLQPKKNRRVEKPYAPNLKKYTKMFSNKPLPSPYGSGSGAGGAGGGGGGGGAPEGPPPPPGGDGAIAVIHYQLKTSTGLQTITKTDCLGGRTPKAALFYQSIPNVNNTSHVSTSSTYSSFGMTDGSRQCCLRTYSYYDTNSDRQHGHTDRVISLGKNTNPFIAANFSQFVPDGIEINHTLADGGAYDGFVVLFAGENLQADLVDTGGTFVGTTPVSLAVDFEPELCFSVGKRSAWTTHDTTEVTYSQGVIHNAGEGVVNMFGQTSWILSNLYLYHNSTNDGFHKELMWDHTLHVDNPVTQAQNFSETGFDVVKDFGGSYSYLFYFLCLSWGGDANFHFIDGTTPASTGDDIYTDIPAPTWTPSFGFWQQGTNGSGYGEQNYHAWYHTAWSDATDDYSITITKERSGGINDNGVYLSSGTHDFRYWGNVIRNTRTLTGFDEGGYTLNYTVTGVYDNPGILIGFGPEA